MRFQKCAVAELVLAVTAAIGCGLSWAAARSTIDVAPVTDGEPATASVAYYAPLLALSLLLATVAGVLLVLAVTRLRLPRREADNTP